MRVLEGTYIVYVMCASRCVRHHQTHNYIYTFAHMFVCPVSVFMCTQTSHMCLHVFVIYVLYVFIIYVTYVQHCNVFVSVCMCILYMLYIYFCTVSISVQCTCVPVCVHV